MARTETKTLAQVVGANLARIRKKTGETQDQCAYRLRGSGLNWTRANVASMESGRLRSIDVDSITLLAVAYYTHADPVRPRDFLVGEGMVELSPGVTWDINDVVDFWWGSERIAKDRSLPTYAGDASERVVEYHFTEGNKPTDTDIRIARKLDVSPAIVVDAALTLWGRTLTEERDRRAGDPNGDARAVRGHVTRQLVREIADHLEGDR